MTFTRADLEQLEVKGITEQQVEQQLDNFITGFPFLRVACAASVNNGIMETDAESEERFIAQWERYLSENHDVMKFVPASGAASRMFKMVYELINVNPKRPLANDQQQFVDGMKKFPFHDRLDAKCKQLYATDIDGLISWKKYPLLAMALVDSKGLNYGAMPKGLLPFHKYEDGIRTPVEEHMVEGAMYAAVNGVVQLHFTVSTEHRALFEQLVAQCQETYAKRYGVTYRIGFSEQKPSTDTIAVTPTNEPFRMNGKLLFRPGGHGALIQNLNDLDADVVFIKNIDNVAPDAMKPDTCRYKKMLAGVLVGMQQKCFEYVRMLEAGGCTHAQLTDMAKFVQNELNCRYNAVDSMDDTQLADYLRRKLNRPIRVCGMVKNVGEPGGGPFMAYNADGTVSPQILESSQIDMGNPEMAAMFQQGTHFNPVDLVCGLKDCHGQPFDLLQHVDPSTGFISSKSKDGHVLKAMELPGLWNGAMSDWNTIFVEVPLSTFNPVKTVNDLLRR